jgi:hypothetical protein
LGGLVDHHLNRLSSGPQLLAQESHQFLPEIVRLPTRLTEEPVEPRMVRRANPRRQHHPRHGVPSLHQHRAGEQQRKDPERRLRERHRKIRQKTIDTHCQRDRIVAYNLFDSQGPALQYLAQFTHWHDTVSRAFLLFKKCETIVLASSNIETERFLSTSRSTYLVISSITKPSVGPLYMVAR